MKLRFLGMGRERIAILVISAAVPLAVPNSVRAAVYSLRDYFAGTQFAAQSETDLWTARSGSTAGPLLLPYPALSPTEYHGTDTLETPRLGSLITASPVLTAISPTFDGLFAHPAATSPLAIVFRADETLYIDHITVYAEGVIAAAQSTGMDISVTQTLDGATTSVGGFFFDYANTLYTAQVHTYLAGSMLRMDEGDSLTVYLGNHGDFYADHANINILIETAPPPVPEAASLMLVSPFLAWAFRRNRGCT